MIPRDTPFTLFMAIHSSVVILPLARAVLKCKPGLTVQYCLSLLSYIWDDVSKFSTISPAHTRYISNRLTAPLQ